jgi:hypothetical protein
VKYDESSEQIAFFRRMAYRKYLGGALRDFCYAIPNGGTVGGRRAIIAGVRRKAEGVSAGVPDVECMVAVPPYTGLHIEMKRKDGKPSDVSESQNKMMERLTQCGRKCVVCFGEEHAWKELTTYLGIKP